MDGPQTPTKPDEPVAKPAAEPPIDEVVAPDNNVATPETSRVVGDFAAVGATAGDRPADPDPDPEPEPEPEPETDSGTATAAVATRYCVRCGDRVPLAADGLHCHVGHPLTGAHRKQKRGWFLRRRR